MFLPKRINDRFLDKHHSSGLLGLNLSFTNPPRNGVPFAANRLGGFLQRVEVLGNHEHAEFPSRMFHGGTIEWACACLVQVERRSTMSEFISQLVNLHRVTVE